MKHINLFKIFLLAAIAPVTAACNGDLDIMQDNKLSASNMWKSSTDVIQSTYGIYERMRSNFVQNDINIFYWVKPESATTCGDLASNPESRTTT